MDLADKLTDITTETKESVSDYYSDIYTPGSTKEQLLIGQEVKEVKEVTGTIDTSDITLSKVDNMYTLSIPNPDGKIFSLEIIGKGEVKRQTFRIGFFGNTALAYSQLETELQALLGSEYTLEYVSGTIFNISRFDGLPITINRPNLVRDIQLFDFTSLTIIDVIVDGVTITLDGAVHGSIASAITYLESQLSSAIYHMFDVSDTLTIARKDLAIPVISKVTYDRFTYALGYRYTDTPSTGQYLDYVLTTIDGVEYKNYHNTFSLGRAYRGYEFVSNLAEISQTIDNIAVGSDSLTTLYLGFDFEVKQTCKLTTITRAVDSTAPKVTLYSGATTLQTEDFSSGSATFNYTLSPGIYSLKAHNDGASYTQQSSNGVEKTNYGEYITIDVSTAWNIKSITTEFILDDDLIIDSAISLTYGNYSYLYLHKADYSAFSISSINHYTTGGFPDDTFATTNVTTNNKADILVTTHTEIVITLSNVSYNYYIPTHSYPKTIIMNAISSGGNSNGKYTYPTQSCTSQSGTTTEFINDKIFKTNSTNYGNIVRIERGGFIISFTTDRSNKLTYTCT